MVRGLIYTPGDNTCSSLSLFSKSSWSLSRTYFSQLLRPYEIKSREAKQVPAKVPSCPHCDGQPGSPRWLRTGLCVLLSVAGAGTDPSNTALPSPRPHWGTASRAKRGKKGHWAFAWTWERGLLSSWSSPIRTIGGIVWAWATHGECFFVNKINPEQSNPEK